MNKKSVSILLVILILLCGCVENSNNVVFENEEQLKKEKHIYCKLLETECINHGEESSKAPDYFAVDDYNGDGILDLLTLTSFNVSSLDKEYNERKFITIFHIKNNKAIKIPIYRLISSWIEEPEYNLYDSLGYEHYKDVININYNGYKLKMYNNNIIYDPNIEFYKVNNKWLTVKLEKNENKGYENFICWNINGYDETVIDEDLGKKYYSNFHYNQSRDSQKKWYKTVMKEIGIDHLSYEFAYDYSRNSFSYPEGFCIRSGSDLVKGFEKIDTISDKSYNYSKVHFSRDCKVTGENIESIEKIKFFNNSIDNRLNYLSSSKVYN